MQLPSSRTPIARCESASVYAQTALRRYAEIFRAEPERAATLESLATTLEGATAALVERQDAYRAAVLALVPLRVAVKLVDLHADDTVRSVQRAAKDAGGDVAEALFPGGVTPIVRAYGATEVAQLRALEGRIAASSWAERDAQLARITDVRVRYEAALKAREEGMVAAAGRRAARDAAKEDFLDVFARVASGVKGEFPRDRRRQDVFFDVLRDTSPARGHDDDEEPPAPAP